MIKAGAALVLLLWGQAASACAMFSAATANELERAEAVFEGELIHRDGSWLTFAVTDVLHGQVPEDTTDAFRVWTPTWTNWRLPRDMEPGLYLVAVHWPGEDGGSGVLFANATDPAVVSPVCGQAFVVRFGDEGGYDGNNWMGETRFRAMIAEVFPG